LKTWDFVLGKDSIPGAIEVMWERALKKAVWERLVPAEAREVFPIKNLSPELMISLLNKPDARFGADPIASRDAMVLGSLDRALEELEKRLGPDMNRWQFGQERFKHVWLGHPLDEAVRPDIRQRLDIPPRARGGSAQTVNSTSDSENQATGASFRVIADTSDWDRSIGTNTPGQSGDVASRHYQDLFKPWTDGDYFPVAYSRAIVEAQSEGKTLMIPGKSKN
jgi:penicillin amidase